MPKLPAPAYIGKTQPSQPYRARDVRADIKELGFEKGVERALTLLADEQAGVRDALKTYAEMLDQMIDIMSHMGAINEQMAFSVKEIKRREEQFDASRGEGV